MGMESHRFLVGDLVRLKAGGPLMSIKFTVQDLLLCIWVDPAGRTRRGTFSADELHLLDAPDLLPVRVVSRLAQRWPVVATC